MKSRIQNKQYRTYKVQGASFILEPHETMEYLAWKIIQYHTPEKTKALSYTLKEDGDNVKMSILVWDTKCPYEFTLMSLPLNKKEL